MQENTEKTNEKTSPKSKNENTPIFKPLISIRRKQTRRIVAQVDEEIARLFDEQVSFVSECCGYDVSAGEVMTEILRGHFGRDNGFKQWRAANSKNGAASSV